jgi:hypothetical protein
MSLQRYLCPKPRHWRQWRRREDWRTARPVQPVRNVLILLHSHDRLLISAGKRRCTRRAPTSPWILGATQTIGALELRGYTRKRSEFIEHRTDISFTAPATALQDFAVLAIERGWPRCELGTASWRGPMVFIECRLIIPYRIVGESREICGELNALIGPSELGGLTGEAECEGN